MSDSEYWYCLTHKTVEGHDGCRNSDRLGPYSSAAEAARALEKVEERNEEWDNDPKWNDDGPGSGDGRTTARRATERSRSGGPREIASPWAFAGMVGLASVFFLLAATPTVVDAPWWVTALLLLAWVVALVQGCRWFVRRPRAVARAARRAGVGLVRGGAGRRALARLGLSRRAAGRRA